MVTLCVSDVFRLVTNMLCSLPGNRLALEVICFAAL